MDELFTLGRRTYRGTLRVGAREQGNLEVRNRVRAHDYLCSVVGREVYPEWDEHALMAQAVAARTYMIYALGSRHYLSGADMAYRGVESEHPSTTRAVERTRGIVLTYGGRILPAYFHSTCGGHTMAVERFADTVEPCDPLAGRPCAWCSRSPSFRWGARIKAEQIAVSLSQSGLARVQAVHSLTPLDKEPDGYARRMLVNGSADVNAYAFRLAVGASRLKSTNFDVAARGDCFDFTGRGHGHGVGLCQWGAQGLAAEARLNWQEILEFYYPGAALRRAAPGAAGARGA
jgi:stage II sporulation protein D